MRPRLPRPGRRRSAAPLNRPYIVRRICTPRTLMEQISVVIPPGATAALGAHARTCSPNRSRAARPPSWSSSAAARLPSSAPRSELVAGLPLAQVVLERGAGGPRGRPQRRRRRRRARRGSCSSTPTRRPRARNWSGAPGRAGGPRRVARGARPVAGTSEEVTPVMEWLARTGKSHDYRLVSEARCRRDALCPTSRCTVPPSRSAGSTSASRPTGGRSTTSPCASAIAASGSPTPRAARLAPASSRRWRLAAAHGAGRHGREPPQPGARRARRPRDPSPAGWRAATARGLAPVAMRVPVPDRLPERRATAFRACTTRRLRAGTPTLAPADAELRGGLAAQSGVS